MGSVEQSFHCLPHIGVCISQEGVLADDARGTEKRCPILVGCIEHHFHCLEKQLEDDVLLHLHQHGQPFRSLLDYSYPIVTNVG